ncbi:MAG: NUDIX hydrolase [Parcubacteria group bacterium GW2011_GWA1_40_21]|nr:MAG: NUDIX hydrolase [Parcubacteria group bacterium GW2011_GWA1_40_21]
MNLKNKMNEQKVQLIPSDLYEKIHMAMPMACVDIIITNINSFLLAKRKNKPAKNQWWFPGGRILKNETLAEAVARKSFEETGLKVEIINRIGVEETIFPDGPFNSSTHTINVTYLAKAVNPKEIKMDEQSSEYGWFSEINEGWHPYVKNFLKIAGFK